MILGIRLSPCLLSGLLYLLAFPVSAQQIYLNAVRYLPETGEFCVFLPFSVREDFHHFQQLENQTTVHPRSHEGLERKRLPQAVAQPYFDLEPYRDLLVFNAAHELVCETVFQGVELFRDDESYFVAVLKPRQGYVSLIAVQSELYCLSKAAEPLLVRRFLSQPIAAASLDVRIAARFGYRSDDMLRLQHTVLYPEHRVYSVLSYAEQRPAALHIHSYLLETLGSELAILMQVTGETGTEEICAILPIPLQVNQRPVLLLHMGLAGTEVSWTQLAVYDGSGYHLINGNWVRAE